MIAARVAPDRAARPWQIVGIGAKPKAGLWGVAPPSPSQIV